jgi:hypothetical protein
VEVIMADARAEQEDIWGPISMRNWRDTPCVAGRVATEDDVKAGRAAFYLELSEGQASHPFDLNLPSCAILRDEDGAAIPVIVIQVETGNNGSVQVLAGYRPLTGGNGLCMFYELELLETPDDRFNEMSAT